eukprot:TRINITY_DN12944_c0_g1_i2.p1 TRINITY_DN12944_c0_g1~~TRINITY_DN12944_c0_g1_i2.p1  ORF type:complete len:453 (+),score=79.31 TRINITY_DN12944_c0_g1_i2:70-1428(+)
MCIRDRYLMRLEPYLEGYIELHSGLNYPARMFNSVKDAYLSASQSLVDVREVVPELFSFPEVFANPLKNQQKEDKKEQEIRELELPEWAEDSVYNFTMIQRQVLESAKVSEDLNEWIDLIFGDKQRGTKAKEACNVYPMLMANPKKSIADYKGPNKEEFRLQAFSWGQIPQQLFVRPHSRRVIERKPKSICDRDVSLVSLTKKDTAPRLSLYTESFSTDKKKAKANLLPLVSHAEIAEISIVSSLENIRFIAITGSSILYEYSIVRGRQMAINLVRRQLLQSTVTTDGYNIYHSLLPLLVIKRKGAEQIVQGGYLDGTIRLFAFSGGLPVGSVTTHCQRVTAMKADSRERFIAVGSSKGECIIYSLSEHFKWTPMKYLLDHHEEITYIDISNEMQLFATASADGSVNVYNKGFDAKLIRTFRHPQNFPINFVFRVYIIGTFSSKSFAVHSLL